MELNKIYNMDFFDFMKNISDNSIDLVVTDPPYKLNKTTGSTTSSSKSEKWQGNLKAGDKLANINNDIKFSEWLPEIYRVLKEQSHCYIWTNDKNLKDLQVEAEKVGFSLHNIIIAKKNNSTPNRWYMKNCEFILFLHKGKSFPINNLGDSHFFEYTNISGKNKLHPTQKPIDITKRLIENSSKIKDIILDPFCGSGTTLLSAKELNRNYIGNDNDIKYFNITKNRIENSIK